MSKISIFVNTYPTSGKYLPMMLTLGDDMCKFYGWGIPRGHILPQELKEKMCITKIHSRIVNFILKPLFKIFNRPNYLLFWSQTRILDYVTSIKIQFDNSEILYANPLFVRTISKAKRQGKIIVLEAGNSDPDREHKRIVDEYAKYGIKHIYIYGDIRFRDTCKQSLLLADKIITISKVSTKTYLNAGYTNNQLHLIPMTGTDFPVKNIELEGEKERVFITTAFHSFIKGTHNLLLAWKKANVKNIPLIVVGALGDDLIEFIEKYGPFDNVVFTGPNYNLKDYYNTLDAVGVLLSLSEGAVRVTPEMMAFGFPMIVSPDATCDLVENGLNGFIVDSTNIDMISERIKWFAEDWTRVHEMRKDVLCSVSKRTMEDWSRDVGQYLLSI